MVLTIFSPSILYHGSIGLILLFDILTIRFHCISNTSPKNDCQVDDHHHPPSLFFLFSQGKRKKGWTKGWSSVNNLAIMLLIAFSRSFALNHSQSLWATRVPPKFSHTHCYQWASKKTNPFLCLVASKRRKKPQT